MRFPLWWRKRRNEELSEEIQAHLTLAEREAMESGQTPREARLAARHEFGNVSVAEEVTRDMWGWRWLVDLWQDARYAVRTLRQRPGFVVVALLTLALGIGATTVMYTVVNGVLLKPLTYPGADKLVAIHGHSDTWNVALYGEQNVTYPDFRDLQRESRFLTMTGSVFNGGTLSAPGEPEHVEFVEVSSDIFSVLGLFIPQGRAFLPDEDRPGAEPVIILGHSLWQRRFGGNPSVIGTRVVLDEKGYTVVGIAPVGFQLDDTEPDALTVLGQDTAGYLKNRRAHPVRVVARLRPRATLRQAQAELTSFGTQLAEQFPATNKGRTFKAEPLRPDVGDVSSTLWLLLGAVSLVLLIACSNVANLLLARAVSREREFAMRAALGATRGRLVRQCLTESAVLGLAGGALGVMLGANGIRPFVAIWPGSLPRVEEIQIDWHVLLFALGVSLLSGVLFGLAPALRMPARNLEQNLRSGARTLAGHSRRLHGSFVISEIALAVVLLVSAGILGRTLLRLSSLDPGVNIKNVLVTRMAFSASALANPAKARVAWQDVLDRARRLPGVQGVALVDTFPMRGGFNVMGYWTNAALPPEDKQPQALASTVTPDYLKVMGIPLREGRFFDDRDRQGSPIVIVIDEVLARNAFGKEDAVGKRLWVPDLGKEPVQVVGVVGHVRHWGLAGDDQATVRDHIYYAYAQLPDNLVGRWSELTSLAVRTGVDPLSLVSALRHEESGATGDQAIYQVRTMEQLASASLSLQHFLLLLFGVFAGLALLLACIGVYGVLAYLTSQRVPEIGVRMALGATPRDVIRLVLRQSLGMILVGAGVGIAGAFMAGRLLERFVAGVRSLEPLTFATMVSVLVVAALCASFVPARRASRVDPLAALRHE